MSGILQTVSSNDENEFLKLSALMVLGDRENQQDYFGYLFKDSSAIVVLCDGMGGYERGDLASNTAVRSILGFFQINEFQNNEISKLKESTVFANENVCKLTDIEGEKIGTGTTVVTVLINDKQFFWNSVGDSRAYLLREGNLAQITLDQNYKTVLEEQVNAGLIDDESYNAEIRKGSALISYLGMGNSLLIDYNSSALVLQKGDRILMMSDGLYKVLSDEEILNVVNNFNNISDALVALEIKSSKKAKENGVTRDNTTMILIEIK